MDAGLGELFVCIKTRGPLRDPPGAVRRGACPTSRGITLPPLELAHKQN